MKRENVAVLVFACDRYELLFKGFNYFFDKNWDKTISLQRYFATETKGLSLDGYTNLKSGHGQWTDRLKRILDQIDEEYIFFIQEDMWLNERMPKGVLIQCIDYMVTHGLMLIKLHASKIYKITDSQINFSGYILSEVIKKESECLMCHQISLWHKDFFYNQLKDNESPWQNEKRGSRRLRKSSYKIYQLDLFLEKMEAREYLNKNKYYAVPCKYSAISSGATLRTYVRPFIYQLEKRHPDYSKKLSYHLQNDLTHDGKNKPRMDYIKTYISEKIVRPIIRFLTNSKM